MKIKKEHKILGLLLVGLLLFGGMGFVLMTTPESERSLTYRSVTPEYAKEMIDAWSCSGCLHIIDIRSPEDFEEGHIIYNNTNVKDIINIPYENPDFYHLLVEYDSQNN